MKKIEDMTQEERDIYLIERAKERNRKYREEATEEEKEDFAKTDAYIDRDTGYRLSGIFYEELPKDHLHNQSYKERLAKAEELNGCKFKDAKPCKDRFAPRDDFSGVYWYLSARGKYDRRQYASLAFMVGAVFTDCIPFNNVQIRECNSFY